MSTEQSYFPAKPEETLSEVVQSPQGFAVKIGRERGPGCFLLLWLIGWTVGCVFLVGLVIKEPKLGNFLFAIPFWASWLAVGAFVVWLWYGRETLLIQDEKVLFVREAFITLSMREIPVEELKNFCECTSDHTENDEHLFGIELQTQGKPLRFGFRLPDRERKWLIFELNTQLEKYCGISTPTRVSAAAMAARASHEEEILTPETSAEQPPSDTSWELVADLDEYSAADSVRIRQRGQWQIGSTLILLFINAFWNGIVSVFVLAAFGLMDNKNPPKGIAFWGMLVFLIPFVVIGLVMFAGLILSAADPLRVTTWRIDGLQIQREIRYAFFRWRRQWSVESIDRLESRRSDENSSRRSAGTMQIGSDHLHYVLAFVTSANKDLCTIDKLTAGEARWIAHLVFEKTKIVQG